jgi:hypothetical protein
MIGQFCNASHASAEQLVNEVHMAVMMDVLTYQQAERRA